MLHVIMIVLVIVAMWFVLSLAVMLVVGRWLHQAGDVPTGPAQRARAVVRGASRLALLPYIVESTAHQQRRRHAQRTRPNDGHDRDAERHEDKPVWPLSS